MRAMWLALMVVILVNLVMCSMLALHHDGHVHPRSINQSRRLLSSVTSLPTSLSKSNEGVKDHHHHVRAMETNLKRAPPSVPNPSQNK